MNIVQNYINYIKKTYRNIFSLILKKQYNKKIIDQFLDKYIETRYYNRRTDIVLDDFELCINHALEQVQEKLVGKVKPNTLEKIYQIFQFILYIDGITKDNCLKEIMIEHTKEEVEEIVSISKNIVKKRKEYLTLFETNQFSISYDSMGFMNQIQLVSLNHNVKISKLYSEYAISKAFNEGIISEDKLFVEYSLVASEILKKQLNCEKIRHYIIDFNVELFKKNKKLHRLIELINDPLVLEHISIKTLYSDFLKYESQYEDLIKQGLQISVMLDDIFECDKIHLEQLVIFDRILIDMNYRNYDYIRLHKSEIKSEIIDVTLVI